MKGMNTAKTLYLHPDGHAVVIHEKTDRRAGRIEWAEAYEALKFDFVNIPYGRVIVTREAIPMLLKSRSLRVHASGGSEATKEKGIKVHAFAMNFGAGDTFIYSYPGLLIGDIQWQTSFEGETWEDIKDSVMWGTARLTTHPKAA